MSNEQLKVYIEERLADLNKEKDMTEVVHKGRLSFGLSENDYRHLPSWQKLVSNKKKLVRVFWAGCFLTSFIVVGLASNVADKLSHNWIEAIIVWIATSLFAMMLYVMAFNFSLFYQVRKTEHEARKLIYEDILAKIETEQQQLV